MQPDFKNWIWDHHREILSFAVGFVLAAILV
jgi:hypothetical protein